MCKSCFKFLKFSLKFSKLSVHSYPIQIVQNWYHCKILKNYRLRGLDLTINSKLFWEGSICGVVLQSACRIELEMYLFDFYQKKKKTVDPVALFYKRMLVHLHLMHLLMAHTSDNMIKVLFSQIFVSILNSV